MRALTDVSGFISPAIPDMTKYWLEKSGGQVAPKRGDIDALDMPCHALPYLLLADVEPDTRRIRFRVVGTNAAHMYNLDFTWRYLDEISLPSSLMTVYHRSYQFVAESKQPLVGHFGYPKRAEIGGFALMEYAMLPFLDGDSVSQILVVDHMGVDGQTFADQLQPMILAKDTRRQCPAS